MALSCATRLVLCMQANVGTWPAPAPSSRIPYLWPSITHIFQVSLYRDFLIALFNADKGFHYLQVL